MRARPLGAPDLIAIQHDQVSKDLVVACAGMCHSYDLRELYKLRCLEYFSFAISLEFLAELKEHAKFVYIVPDEVFSDAHSISSMC